MANARLEIAGEQESQSCFASTLSSAQEKHYRK
jgi:hypothetical protein